MIREATIDDVPRLVEMGGRFVANSIYAGRMANNPKAQCALMLRMIEHPDGQVYVSEESGKITGMVGVAALVHPWSGEWMAEEVFWWVEPEARGPGIKLLKRAEQWADAKSCVRLRASAPNPKVARAYWRLGYTKVEESFQKDI